MFVITRPQCKPSRCDTGKRCESLKAKSAVKEVNGKKPKPPNQTKNQVRIEQDEEKKNMSWAKAIKDHTSELQLEMATVKGMVGTEWQGAEAEA